MQIASDGLSFDGHIDHQCEGKEASVINAYVCHGHVPYARKVGCEDGGIHISCNSFPGE